MTEDDFRNIALGFDGAVEGSHMGHPDFRANGRIFATLHGNGTTGMVKVTPAQQAEFLREHPKGFRALERRVGPSGLHERHAGRREAAGRSWGHAAGVSGRDGAAEGQEEHAGQEGARLNQPLTHRVGALRLSSPTGCEEAGVRSTAARRRY